ncbi:hypothetical protein HDU98_003858 [Podochytrium sp. JEL0797]|nr:hypothetical protein HDU98_003858 [Podochytrium sp. JEL0797]
MTTHFPTLLAKNLRPCKTLMFDVMGHERPFLLKHADRFRNMLPLDNNGTHTFEMDTLKAKCDERTVELANGFDTVGLFVNDFANKGILERLKELGVRHIALRSAGFDHVDLGTAKKLGMVVSRVPQYSPYAIAEFAVALALCANRRIVPAANRVKTGNFSLSGLVGFDFHGKTVGVVGTGQIGQCFIKIMQGFGCKILCYDPYPNKEVASWTNVQYVPLEQLYSQSRLISLHCPSTPENKHMINAASLALMQKNTMLVNTSRGDLIDTVALIQAITDGRIGCAGLDVYEKETNMYFEDHSDLDFIADKTYARILGFNNVVVTGHQGFLTTEAVDAICDTVFHNILAFSLLKAEDQSKEAVELREMVVRNRLV